MTFYIKGVMNLIAQHNSDIWKGSIYLCVISAETYQRQNPMGLQSIETDLFSVPSWLTLMIDIRR